MSFILRVYIIGLMAFVPSGDGKRMAVLMVDARAGYHASDGSFFPPHVPMLVAKAGSCKGACDADLGKAARHLSFAAPETPSEVLANRLREAIAGGTVWQINGEDLAVLAPAAASGGLKVAGQESAAAAPGGTVKALPGDAVEKTAFRWVPQIGQVVRDAGAVDPDCLASKPQKGLVAGRLQLDQGTLKTDRMVEFYVHLAGGVPTFLFKPLSPSPSMAPSKEASPRGIADWTVVDIPIQGCEVTLSARPFGGNAQTARTMTLAPSTCGPKEVVEIALINLPDRSLLDTEETGGHQHAPEGIASHFEIYYELANQRLPLRQRLVPVVTGTYSDPAQLSQGEVDSKLLTAIGMAERDHGGTFSRPICTQTVFNPSSQVQP